MTFEAAAGSIVGSAHLRAGRNGQDGFAFLRDGDTTVAVVTDGCGSAPHSEVGAKLGAAVVARVLARASEEDAAGIIADELRAIALAFGGDLRRVVNDYLLFTIVAAVIGPRETTILSAGDGLFAINGQRHVIGPFAENAPPYLGYALAGGGIPELTVQRRLPTTDVRTILLGTDGAERIDDLQPYWTDDVVFRNPDAIRRRLFLLTRPGRAVLDDDTTLLVLRRAA